MTVTINGTTGLAGVDGSAGTPAIQGGDTNTGMFFPAADTIAFAEGGAEIARFDSSGQLGIGTTSPSSVLNVKSDAPVFRLETTGTVSSSGTASYAIRDSTGADVFNYGYLGLANCFQFGTIPAAGFMRFLTGAQVEAMRINSSGNLLVGTTSGTSRLYVRGAGATSATTCIYADNSSGTTLFNLRNDGYMTTGTAAASPYNATVGSAANLHVLAADGGLYRATSSIKYKRDVVDYTKGLDAIATLRPVFYKGTNPIEGDTVYAGLIAEEVHEAGLTEFVQYNQDHEPEGLAYGNMVALLTKAIQEQQVLITALTARITALEAK
jgi:hypothetical protein